MAEEDLEKLDEQKLARAKERAKHQRAKDRAVLKSLMETENGRSWVWRFLSEFHMFASSWAPDPHVTSFREGERNVALRFTTMLMDAAPGSFAKMQQENSGGTDE